MTQVYPSALGRMLRGELDLLDGTVTAHLVSAGYTPNFAADAALSDIAASHREASAMVTGKAVDVGDPTRFTASSTTFPAATGDPVRAVVLECDGYLVAYVDDFGAGAGATTLSLNGSDITVNWSSSGVFTLDP